MVAMAAAVYTAMVAGSTGAVGRDLVVELVNSAQCGKVIALTRREIPRPQWPDAFPRLDMDAASSKLEVRAINFDAMTAANVIQQADKVDASFSCLGTTRQDSPTVEAYRKVDFEYVTNFAKLSRAADVPYFAMVTSRGAHKDSWFEYTRTKGKAEANVTAMGFPRVSIFRPGMIDRGDARRTIEKWTLLFISGVSSSAIAKGMFIDYESGTAGVTEWSDSMIREQFA